MARILTKEEFLSEKSALLREIKRGALFIHRTDTIYGIGCDATDPQAVGKVREAKKRADAPFSVIAPSKEWVHTHCALSDKAKQWLDRLPGPYTLILPLRPEQEARHPVAREVNLGAETIGVRIPDHWFSAVVAELGRPTVTTSANVHGKPFMTSLGDLDPAIRERVLFVVDEGQSPKNARPSVIVDLTGESETILKR